MHSLYEDPEPAEPGGFRVPRLYASSILDYCNCPDGDGGAADVPCEGSYELGAALIGEGPSERAAVRSPAPVLPSGETLSARCFRPGAFLS